MYISFYDSLLPPHTVLKTPHKQAEIVDVPASLSAGLRSWSALLETGWGCTTSHLIIVGVIQILVIIIRSLAFLHLVPDGPLAWGRMAVIHRIICIAGGPNV